MKIESLEHEIALVESLRNDAVDAYMAARPNIDTPKSRKLFEDGFDRAWLAFKKEILAAKEEGAV